MSAALFFGSVMLAGILLMVEKGMPVVGGALVAIGLAGAFWWDHNFGRAAQIRARKERAEAAEDGQ